MKKKIKYLIAYFIGALSPAENKISIQDLSIFFSILIATLILRKNRNKSIIINASYDKYHSEFKTELQLIKKRFPELIRVYTQTKSNLRHELLLATFEMLKIAFENIDEDVDDIISWSYQFLKKGLENTLLKIKGKNGAKVQDSDILFRTQFFTDKYMVRYLVDKCLSGINKKDILNVVVIDCASGGGNFLTYSFERLYWNYKKARANWSSQHIVDSILNNAIIGYDLDNNLSNIASLSLFVKACTYATPSNNTHIYLYGGIPNDNLGFLNPNISSCFVNRSDFNFKMLEINKKKKIKVFVTNPPFMGKRDMDISLKNYLLYNYPQSKGDLCASFIQKLMKIMNKEDILGVVSQNNWMYLTSFRDFRRSFLEKYTLKSCVDLGSNAFEDINGEKTNVALCVISISDKSSSRFYNLSHKQLDEKKVLLAENSIPTKLIYELHQNLFLKNRNYEFNYRLEHGFEILKRLHTYSDFARPMQGTSTGNNSEFVKYAWEVNGCPDWKLVSKGGGFSKWMGLNYYKVRWGKNAEIIKANKGSALRNIDKISSTHLVYSDTGTLGLNVRVLKENQVFIASGPGIQVLKGDKYAHLAFLNSRIATFFLKVINPKFTISAGYISKLPVAESILNSRVISSKSKKCLELKKSYLQSKLPNFEFQHYNYESIYDVNLFIETLIRNDVENDYKRLILESDIELEIKNEYNFSMNELTEIKSTVGESPVFNKNKSKYINLEALDSLYSSYIDLNCLSISRSINGYSIGSESTLEALSYKFDVNPKLIYNLIKNNISLLKRTKAKYYNDLLHKIILHELGVKHITVYQFNTIKSSLLVNNIKTKYAFLRHQPELIENIYSILNCHHLISFFNKPLFILANEFLIVGQPHNE